MGDEKSSNNSQHVDFPPLLMLTPSPVKYSACCQPPMVNLPPESVQYINNMQRKLDHMESKCIRHTIEINKLEEDNKGLQKMIVELEVDIVELNSKLMVKVEEAAIKDDA